MAAALEVVEEGDAEDEDEEEEEEDGCERDSKSN